MEFFLLRCLLNEMYKIYLLHTFMKNVKMQINVTGQEFGQKLIPNDTATIVPK